MKFETLINLVGSAIFGLIGLSALIGAIFFGAWWHFVTFGMCALMALCYTQMMSTVLKAWLHSSNVSKASNYANHSGIIRTEKPMR